MRVGARVSTSDLIRYARDTAAHHGGTLPPVWKRGGGKELTDRRARVRRVNAKRPTAVIMVPADDREGAAVEILLGWLDELRRARAGSN